MTNIFHFDSSYRIKKKFDYKDEMRILELLCNKPNLSPIMRRFYELILISLSKNPIYFRDFNLLFLNEDDEFSKAENLFYFNSSTYIKYLEEEIKFKNIKKNLKVLKLPDTNLFDNENELKDFLRFCSDMKVTIYDDVYFKVKTYKPKTEVCNKIKQEITESKILENISNLRRLNYKNILEKFKKMTFYRTSDIIITYQPKDEKYGGLAFYELDMDFGQIDIYYINNDVYTSWKHSTIYPLICKILSDILFEGAYFEDLLLSHFYKDKEFEVWRKMGFKSLDT